MGGRGNRRRPLQRYTTIPLRFHLGSWDLVVHETDQIPLKSSCVAFLLVSLSCVDTGRGICSNYLMTYEEYKKLRQQIANDYQRELSALDMVWKRCQAINSPSNAPLDPNLVNDPEINFSKHVRIVLTNLKQNFSTDDVAQALVDHGLVEKDKIKSIRIALTNTLHRLYRRKEIEVVQKGHGRIGSTYKVINLKGGQCTGIPT